MVLISNRSKNAMKKTVGIFMILLLVISFTVCRNNNASIQTNSNNQANKISKSDKILIVYFSLEGNTTGESVDSNVHGMTRASFTIGNTGIIADQIHEAIGGDIFEIKTLDPYPSDYDIVLDQAKKEQNSGYKPALKIKVSNMESYDIVFIGYPIWWGTLPMAVEKFLTEYDLSRKTIIPFNTHDGSHFGRSIDDIKKLCPNSTILDGFGVVGKSSKDAKNDVLKWLQSIRVYLHNG